ncbi:MAG: hypothetical protein WKF48_05890 [Solirubrobacteraceae bacterium]
MTASVAPRLATVVSWTRGYERQRFVTHVAVGDRTICGVELSGTRTPAPAASGAVELCSHCQGRKR